MSAKSLKSFSEYTWRQKKLGANNMLNGWIKIYRKLLENEIWLKPAWWLKVWIYILLRVNFEDTSKYVKGSTFISYDEIYLSCNLSGEGIKKKAIQNVISWSTERQMLRTEKRTRGFVVTIINYEVYQSNEDSFKDTEKDRRRTDEGQTKDTILEEVRIKKEEKKEKNLQKKESHEVIDEIYAAYPATCPVQKRSLGKSHRDKLKIAKLLTEKSRDELLEVISLYLADCVKTNSYVKNFSTFLNNLPDLDALRSDKQKAKDNNRPPEVYAPKY